MLKAVLQRTSALGTSAVRYHSSAPVVRNLIGGEVIKSIQKKFRAASNPLYALLCIP
jgi:hypothetical protein